MFAPNYKFTGKLSSTTAYVNYHKEKWVYILKQNSNDPALLKILAFLKKNNISIDTCATRLAGFFSFTSNKIHFKKLQKMSNKAIKLILKNRFSIKDPLTVDLVILLVKTM